jgi:hypothetical protein
MERGRKLIVVIAVLVVCITASNSFAQFQGSIGAGVSSSSNIDGLDSSVSDHIISPIVNLGYTFNISALSKVSIGANFAPDYYNANPTHSYEGYSFTATPTFYLSNQKAIQAESIELRHELAQEARQDSIDRVHSTSEASELPVNDGATSADTPSGTAATTAHESTSAAYRADATDSIIDYATSGLYLLGESLDSLDYRKLGKAEDAMSALRDSISDQVNTLADLLDSLPFSRSFRQVALDQLTAIKPSLDRVIAKAVARDRILTIYKSVVYFVTSAIPQPDYMPVVEPPEPTPSVVLSKDTTNRTHLTPRTNPETRNFPTGNQLEPTAEVSDKAPTISLISSAERLRYTTSQDFTIIEDAATNTATTLATSLTFPISFEVRKNRDIYTAYDYSTLSIQGTGEVFSGRTAQFNFTYDFLKSNYPNDSIYSNIENRFRISTHIALGTRIVLLLDGGFGYKSFTTPLSVDSVGIGKLKRAANVASSFAQWTLGAGYAQFLGDRVVLGLVGSVTRSPSLRAYVDQTGNPLQGRTASVSDDEYTYDLSRLMLYATTRLIWDIDLSGDIVVEHRKYGSVFKQDKKVVTAVTGADREENASLLSIYVGRDFPFDDERLFGAFNDLTLQFTVNSTKVHSSLSQYSYTDAGFGLSFSLGF